MGAAAVGLCGSVSDPGRGRRQNQPDRRQAAGHLCALSGSRGQSQGTKKVFNVAEGFLLACFDHDVTEETVKAIAKMKPYYAVFRDSSMANDSVATNFDQIFETYSPETVRKVL